MKTRKLVLITGILAIAFMSFAVTQKVNAAEDTHVKTTRKTAQMTFEEAISNESILLAMYDQIENDILPNVWPYYTARIQYRGVNVFIIGSLQEWLYFFKQQRIYKRTRQQ